MDYQLGDYFNVFNQDKNLRTSITSKDSCQDGKWYEVEMIMKSENKKIKVTSSRIENGFGFFEEFQKVINFDIMFDKQLRYLYIFRNKDDSNFFLNNLIRNKVIFGNKVKFDFKLLKNLEFMKDAWGIWFEGSGDIRKTGQFGINLEENIEDYNLITTVYLDCEYKTENMNNPEDSLIQLILSKEGSISTKSKFINDKKMLNLFQKIYEIIGKF